MAAGSSKRSPVFGSMSGALLKHSSSADASYVTPLATRITGSWKSRCVKGHVSGSSESSVTTESVLPARSSRFMSSRLAYGSSERLIRAARRLVMAVLRLQQFSRDICATRAHADAVTSHDDKVHCE